MTVNLSSVNTIQFDLNLAENSWMGNQRPHPHSEDLENIFGLKFRYTPYTTVPLHLGFSQGFPD
jgi:hypothetical protein